MAAGSFPDMPGTPIGQVIVANRAAGIPRRSIRRSNARLLVIEPIKPKYA
jgi:hypothetical protein